MKNPTTTIFLRAVVGFSRIFLDQGERRNGSEQAPQGMAALDAEDLRRSYARICARARRRRTLDVPPEAACEKCGAVVWEAEMDGMWYCFKCGARGVWEDGVFRQARGARHA